MTQPKATWLRMDVQSSNQGTGAEGKQAKDAKYGRRTDLPNVTPSWSATESLIEESVLRPVGEEQSQPVDKQTDNKTCEGHAQRTKRQDFHMRWPSTSAQRL